MNNSLGLYIHIPFCKSKCAYCDFYSYSADEVTYDRYTAALCQHIEAAGVRLLRAADTLYFGGGTPSLLGGERIAKIINYAKNSFKLNNAEITVEVNPGDDLSKDLKILAEAGVNRLSIGVQSSVDAELKILSRRHSNNDVIKTVNDAKKAGIHNISVDVMLGIPNQTEESLKATLDFALSLDPTHVSCYILKIEPDTPFGKANIKSLNLPNEDTVADLYLFTSDYLQLYGFEHYEISNFAKKGYRSRHNLKYWNCEEYLGLGPSAHSFLNGKRYYFDRNNDKYISSPQIIFDSIGGDVDEYIMLKMRLSDGLNLNNFRARFNKEIDPKIINKAKKLETLGLVKCSNSNISLTKNGFLLSNSCISELIF